MLRLRDRTRTSVQGGRQAPARWLKATLGGDRRWVRRAACRTMAGFRECQQTGIEVEILNLSTHGCAARSAVPQRIGADCWLTLPTLESWYAKVAWCDGDLFGVDFAAPLHRAVAEMIVHRARGGGDSYW
jgi:hypothetical protein